MDRLATSFPTARGRVRAVDGVSLELAEGETLGIVGESGSGKSVLIRSIMGLLPPTATRTGEVRYRGRDLTALSPAKLRRLWGTEIAMVFQDATTALNGVKRVGVHITESLRRHTGLGRKAARERALDLLAQVGIPDPKRRIDQYPHELSGGMRQRVTIAIALACEPRLLMADEPTTALDATVQRQILDLLSELQAERRMAMILVTHDLGVVAGRTDRVAVMYAGRLAETAPTRTLFGSVRHPYTEGLLRSVPRIDQPSHTRLPAIAGRPPDLANLPDGCRFAARCPHAEADCGDAAPVLEEVAAGHAVACHHPVLARDASLERRARRGKLAVAPAALAPDGAGAPGTARTPAGAPIDAAEAV
ncbi:MAG TPA: ABC transporter ATP-binding protein [Acidimicrobiales bacterium]